MSDIYLDNNATTPVADEVVAAMMPFLTDQFANPSSPYTFARTSSEALRLARLQVADMIQAPATGVTFTSGATEANNAAFFSALSAAPEKRHVVTTMVEHASVLAYCRHLERHAYRVTYLPVDREGHLDLDQLETAVSDDTALVSVMMANNETGILFPVDACAELAHARGALFHTDAVQVAGKLPLSMKEAGADYLSLSGHKLHGPKGIGVLAARDGVSVTPYVMGGEQENGRRGGTENVPGIVGFGKATEIALACLPDMGTRVRALRNDMERALTEAIPALRVAGSEAGRLPNTSSLLFEGLASDAILAWLDMHDICCSSGSACASGTSEPSHVLEAMGIPAVEAKGVIRVSMSRYTTRDDMNRLVSALVEIARKLRTKAKSAANGS